jgi:hypothetical protein
MDHNPDDKLGDDYPEDRPAHDDTQPFPFIPTGVDKTLKKLFQVEEQDEEGIPPNPHRQEPGNKPS